jgi:predicted Zn-dependent peptidase
MGKGMSSRLFQEVREKRGLSYDISSRMQFFTDAGMFTVTAGVDPSKEALAVKTIEKEIDKIRSKKVSASELKRIKEFMLETSDSPTNGSFPNFSSTAPRFFRTEDS